MRAHIHTQIFHIICKKHAAQQSAMDFADQALKSIFKH